MGEYNLMGNVNRIITKFELLFFMRYDIIVLNIYVIESTYVSSIYFVCSTVANQNIIIRLNGKYTRICLISFLFMPIADC